MPRSINETAVIHKPLKEVHDQCIRWLKQQPKAEITSKENPITALWHENIGYKHIVDIFPKEIEIYLSEVSNRTLVSITFEVSEKLPESFGFLSDWRYKLLDLMKFIDGLDSSMFNRLISEKDIVELRNQILYLGLISLAFLFIGQFIFGYGWNQIYLILIFPIGAIV